MIKFLNNFKANKKSAFGADSLGSRNDSISPALTSVISIANSNGISISNEKKI
jgi:hypothetical protein